MSNPVSPAPSYGSPAGSPVAQGTAPSGAAGGAPEHHLVLWPRRRRTGMGKKTVGALSVIGIVLVAGAVVISKFGLSNLLGDATAEARVGDCLGTLPVEDTGTSAELVGCDSADARYVVVGRVDDRTEREVRSDRVCAAFAETEALYYMLPDGGGTGYVLCLKPVKK